MKFHLMDMTYSLFTVDGVDVVRIEAEFSTPPIAVAAVPLCCPTNKLLSLFAAELLLLVVSVLLFSPFKLFSDTLHGNAGFDDFYMR